MKKDINKRIKEAAKGIRRRVLEHTINNNGGYLSQACSSSEILAALYLRIMNLGPVEAPIMPPPFTAVPGPDNPNYTTGAMFNGPKAPHLDRFFLSITIFSCPLRSAYRDRQDARKGP